MSGARTAPGRVDWCRSLLAPRGETDLAPLNVDLKPPYTDESMGERMKPRQLLRVIRGNRICNGGIK